MDIFGQTPSLFDGNYEFENFNSTSRIEARKIVSKNKRKSLLVQREESLMSILPDISEGEQLYLVSNENFGSIELLSVLTARLDVEEVHITTWSYNEDFIHLIESLLQRGVKVWFNCDKSIKARKTSYWAQMADLKYKHKGLLSVKLHDLIHSKVTLLKAKEGYFSVEASANYSKNTRIEQFSITNERERYEFNREWISLI